MNHFRQRKSELWAEDVPLSRIALEVGTPAYVYSRATLTRHYRVFERAFAGVPHQICFSVKACSNLGVLATLAQFGSGFDIVSGGELYRVQRAGADMGRVVFSGVGKTAAEIDLALEAGVFLFNAESEAEVDLLEQRAAHAGSVARISLRVNPEVDARTHPYIATGLRESKFGIPLRRAERVWAKQLRGSKWLTLAALDCHIGSQLTSMRPVSDALRLVRAAYERLRARGAPLTHLDLGGGLGITYRGEEPPSPKAYAAAVKKALRGLDVKLILEPGRVIAGNAGLLLTRVIREKAGAARRFVVVDAAMNDLIRPALYGAHHAIEPVRSVRGKTRRVDVVGPVCESADFLGKGRMLPALQPGDLLAVRSAGAYGFSMSSNYNSRPRAAEVLVDGDQYAVVRERETLADLVRGERLPPLEFRGHNPK